MVRWPWQRTGDDAERPDNGDASHDDESEADPIVECSFQDGSLAVYDTRVEIRRARRSRHEDKTITMDRIRGVTYEKGLTIGYLQIEEDGVRPDTAGLLSDPVDENTLHFGRRDRECARNARDAIEARRP